MICAEEKWAENARESVDATQNFNIALQSECICSVITGLLTAGVSAVSNHINK